MGRFDRYTTPNMAPAIFGAGRETAQTGYSAAIIRTMARLADSESGGCSGS